MRSAIFGLRLCGIADDPFIPAANGSSTSRTSVRARWRISVANRSSDVAHSASVPSSSAWRSRAITWVETGSGSRPRRSQAMRSTSGSIAAYVPTVPESWPTRHVSSALLEPLRGRGRARTPSRRASSRRSSARRGCRASARCRPSAGAPRRGARRRRAPRSTPRRIRFARVADLERERRVDDVRRREAVVDPAALGPELLCHRIDEGGEIVVGRPLDLGDALGRRRRPRGRGSRRRPRRARRRPRPSRRALPVRPRTSARACPPPTRSGSFPDGSSGRSLRTV